jgi:hypothetical protein
MASVIRRASAVVLAATWIAIAACRGAPQGEPGRASVTCAENPGDDVIDCEVEHLAGNAGVNACWTVVCRCKNGREAKSARLCQSVQRGATVRKSIPLSELGHASECDRVLASDVRDLEVKAL